MKRHAESGDRARHDAYRLMFARAVFCVAGAALAGGVRCGAQAEAQPGDTSLYTLHTYANLVQIPTLVLSWKSTPLPPIPLERFAIRLDYGPAFHPTAMHIEGNDAIELAVLLDASGDQRELLKHFGDALATLVPGKLLDHDHVTVYAVDCELIRSAPDLPPNALALGSAVTGVLENPALHGKHGRGCAGDLHLRGSLMVIAMKLAEGPGRRVILAVTDGQYDQSTASWAEAGSFISRQGVAVFAIGTSADAYRMEGASRNDGDLFSAFCETTGGMVLSTNATKLASTVDRVISLVRGRYILEFPRPDDDHPGLHQVDVSVPGTHDFIVHTGATVRLLDPATAADPNTVRTTKSPATYGKSHPIKPEL